MAETITLIEILLTYIDAKCQCNNYSVQGPLLIFLKEINYDLVEKCTNRLEPGHIF